VTHSPPSVYSFGRNAALEAKLVVPDEIAGIGLVKANRSPPGTDGTECIRESLAAGEIADEGELAPAAEVEALAGEEPATKAAAVGPSTQLGVSLADHGSTVDGDQGETKRRKEGECDRRK